MENTSRINGKFYNYSYKKFKRQRTPERKIQNYGKFHRASSIFPLFPVTEWNTWSLKFIQANIPHEAALLPETQWHKLQSSG